MALSSTSQKVDTSKWAKTRLWVASFGLVLNRGSVGRGPVVPHRPLPEELPFQVIAGLQLRTVQVAREGVMPGYKHGLSWMD